MEGSGGEVVLPNGWGENHTIGTGSPGITISNRGYTEVTVGEKDKSIETLFYYEPYGLDVRQEGSEQIAYYQGERVRLFVDMLPDNSFAILHLDREGIVDVETVKDEQGNITGLALKDEDEVDALIRDLEDGTVMPASPEYIDGELYFINFNATYHDDYNGIVACDISVDEADRVVQDWISAAATPGVYILKTGSGDSFTTYIYYNDGGRYPWQMDVENGRIIKTHSARAATRVQKAIF